MNSRRTRYLTSLAVSVTMALLIGALIMLITGHDPLDGYGALLAGAFGSKRVIGTTLYKTGQLAITGLATAVASSSGIFNVGGEGQMYLGALASCYLGARLTGLSPWLAIPLCLLAAILSGAVYAWIPAVLKVKLKINEVITTILMNTIAIAFCKFMANGPLKTMEKGVNAGTDSIDKAFRFNKLIAGSSLTESIFYVIVISLLVWYLMSRTTAGYRMRMTGQNSRFARYSGLKADRLAIAGMLISGAMCGMLGMFECFSGPGGRFTVDFSKEFYFDGMLVAMIMQYKPLGIILMSFFFGILKVGAVKMQSQGIPSELILIVQSVIIFFMAAQEGFLTRIAQRKASRAVALTVRKDGDQ